MKKSIVLVTGALTGIGRATALAFANQGDMVVISGRHVEAGNALAEEIGSLALELYGSDCQFIKADVRDEGEVRNLVDQTVERFGRIDIAVNNAGTHGVGGPITEQTAGTYAATFDTNVLGVILSMKHEVRVMQEQGSGSIINISSVYGHSGVAGASLYAGSKHALEGLTKSVALEVVHSGIRVNAVSPGATDTDALTRFSGKNRAALVSGVPIARLGHPEEIANEIVFIASAKASFISGHILHVHGGLTIH